MNEKFDPKKTAVTFRWPNDFEVTFRIDPDLDEYIKALKMSLDILGGKITAIRKPKKQQNPDL